MRKGIELWAWTIMRRGSEKGSPSGCQSVTFTGFAVAERNLHITVKKLSHFIQFRLPEIVTP